LDFRVEVGVNPVGPNGFPYELPGLREGYLVEVSRSIGSGPVREPFFDVSPPAVIRGKGDDRVVELAVEV
jgi:hypothetical protein